MVCVCGEGGGCLCLARFEMPGITRGSGFEVPGITRGLGFEVPGSPGAQGLKCRDHQGFRVRSAGITRGSGFEVPVSPGVQGLKCRDHQGCIYATATSRRSCSHVSAHENSVIINNNRRLVTLAEHTSDHGRQTNSSTEEKGEQV